MKFKFDPSLTEQRMFGSKNNEKGTHVLAVLKVKPGKLEEGLAEQAAWQSNFTNIEGLECKIEVYSNIIESFSAAGVEPPRQ